MRDAKQFWLDNFGTDFSKPCWYCGQFPRVGDLWRIEVHAAIALEGHVKCFEAVYGGEP